MKILSSARGEAARAAAYAELASIIARFAPIDGEHATALAPLTFYRYSKPTRPECGLAKAALIMAGQGAKRITVGGHAYDYDRGRALITSIDLPMLSHVTQASRGEPYLCIVLALDLPRVGEVLAQMQRPPETPGAGSRAIATYAVADDLLDAVLRLARLLDTPQDLALLAPLIEREIVYRLLQGEQGARLRQIAIADSQSHKIGRAVDWLRSHYAQPLRMEALAQAVNMSVSSLHHHFKDVTSLSPLQYQKQLRLHEARRLLAGQACDVASAARRVGYESASQFSREYLRLFGAPPSRDSVQLRAVAYAAD